MLRHVPVARKGRDLSSSRLHLLRLSLEIQHRGFRLLVAGGRGQAGRVLEDGHAGKRTSGYSVRRVVLQSLVAMIR